LTGPLVSIILPIYKQADHIAEIVDRFLDALRRSDVRFEILLVVNGSPPDGSRAACDVIAAREPAVLVFEEARAGWGRAVKRGIRESRGELICYTNSARTTERELLLSILYARAFPDTIVKANRRIRESAVRRIGSLLYNLECRTLFDLSVWDINGTPKVFPREYRELLALDSDDDIIDLEFNVVCRERSFPMIEVPIFSSRRHGGKSTTNYGSALRMYAGAYLLFRKRRAIQGG
jgi:glycosyltransferase involved in cell wall biosynthesis